MVRGTGGFWMHSYRNWWATGQEQKNTDNAINFSFRVYNVDRTKNRDITKNSTTRNQNQ